MTAPAMTLKEARKLPATVDVSVAAQVLGVSRSALYEAIRAGRCPARVLQVGGRKRVVTSSLLALLEDDKAAAGPRS